MKDKILYLLLLAVFAGWLSSCTDDEDDFQKEQEETHTVTYKVYTNTPGVPVSITGGFASSVLFIKDYYEATVYGNKHYVAEIEAICNDDPKTLITGEIYVDGKLRGRQEGNGYMKVSVVLKGHPM